MPRRYLADAERFRQSRLLSVNRTGKGQLALSSPPPTKASGMYWIYTDYPVEVLQECTQSPQKGAVDIGRLARQHEGLAHVCTIAVSGFRVVYNGVAGGKCGLRERIHQHFNGGEGTGALSICRSSLAELAHWRVSYVLYSPGESDQPEVACDPDYHRDLERLWRLQHGWPLLCRV